MIKKFLSLFSLAIISLCLSTVVRAQATLSSVLPLKAEQLPPLEILEESALRWAGLNPAQIADWEKGVRWAAALPSIQVGWESSFLNQNTSVIQDNISVTSAGVTIGPESNRLDLDLKDDRNFEIKAVWALDELLFNRDALLVSREARDLYLVRSRILQELQTSYYELKSLLLAAQTQPQEPADPWKSLKVEQSFEKLNSLTGGELKKLLEKNRNTGFAHGFNEVTDEKKF